MVKYLRDTRYPSTHKIFAVGEPESSVTYGRGDTAGVSNERPYAVIHVNPGQYLPAWDFSSNGVFEMPKRVPTYNEADERRQQISLENSARQIKHRRMGLSNEYLSDYHRDNPVPLPDDLKGDDHEDDEYLRPRLTVHETVPVPETLFFTTRPRVDYLTADRSMRFAVPTLLGAALQYGQDVGQPVEADKDLSKHSLPIVQRGIDAGLVVMHPDARDEGPKVTNNLSLGARHGFRSEHPVGRPELEIDSIKNELRAEEVPEETVAGWRNQIRSVLRPNRPRKPMQSVVHDAPQFEQLRLDI